MNLLTSLRHNRWSIIAVLLAALLMFAFVSANGDPGTFAITLLSGLLRASLLFLVAAGLSLIFGLMDILNFAQGAYFMIGAYLAFDIQHPQMGILNFADSVESPEVRFAIGVVFALVVGGGLGYVLERGFLRRMYSRPLFQLVLTFGVSIILQELIRTVWGTTPYSWTELLAIQEASFMVFGQQFSTYRLFVIVVGALLMVGVTLLLRYSRIGIVVRAGVQDAEMVSALGINVRAVFTLVFTMGCALAAFGGAISAPFLGATISLGGTFLLASIAVIVLGGLGSFEGTAIGSILVGIGWAAMEQFSVRPEIGTVWASITPMLMLTLILLVRPGGLFGEDR